MRKKTILIIIILAIGALGIYQSFIKEEKPSLVFEKVSRGAIFEKVSETGQVKKGEEIKLGFQNAGKIERIYVKVGDEIEENSILAKLETTSLYIQLEEAKAAKEMTQAKLNKLLAGVTPEEIKVAETAVSNARTSLEAVQQSLEDTKKTCQENLDIAYEDALNILDSSYLEGEKSLTLVDTIFRTYFVPGDQPWVVMKDNREKIESTLKKIKPELDMVKADPKDENIDKVLAEMQESLSKIQEALTSARQATEDPNYRNVVPSTDKTSLDTQRTSINTALTNITDSQQTISSTKLTNESSINTAQAKVSTAEGALVAAQDNLALIKTEPLQADVDLYQAQIKQSDAEVQLLENRIREATLKSPTDGKITQINKRVGEMAQPMLAESIISLVPVSPFEIKVDIYEEEVVKIKVGNSVDISLVAFPDQLFIGKVLSINPTEELIEGVVYYEVTIGFIKEPPEGIKPGMTADVVIKTASKENVLIISKEAIQKKNGKVTVQVFKDGLIQEREIEIGLEGSNDVIEIISGLTEGEEVVID